MLFDDSLHSPPGCLRGRSNQLFGNWNRKPYLCPQRWWLRGQQQDLVGTSLNKDPQDVELELWHQPVRRMDSVYSMMIITSTLETSRRPSLTPAGMMEYSSQRKSTEGGCASGWLFIQRMPYLLAGAPPRSEVTHALAGEGMSCSRHWSVCV
jgi:hypothetical protein